MGRPIYQGRDSCYALREGMYVKRVEKLGIDTIGEAAGILRLICRDKRRGWTYDDDCGCCKVRMTESLFEKRAVYVKTLAVKHGATERELKIIDNMIDYVLRHHRLPKKYSKLADKYIVKAGAGKTRKRSRRRSRRKRRSRRRR